MPSPVRTMERGKQTEDKVVEPPPAPSAQLVNTAPQVITVPGPIVIPSLAVSATTPRRAAGACGADGGDWRQAFLPALRAT